MIHSGGDCDFGNFTLGSVTFFIEKGTGMIRDASQGINTGNSLGDGQLNKESEVSANQGVI